MEIEKAREKGKIAKGKRKKNQEKMIQV